MTPPNLPPFLQKMTICLAVLAWVALLNGGFAIYQLNQINEQSSDILDQTMTSIAVVGRLSADLESVRTAEANRILLLPKTDKGRWTDAILTRTAKVTAGIRQYESLDSSTEQKRVFVDFLTFWYDYAKRVETVSDTSAPQATAAYTDNASAYRQACQSLQRLSALSEERGHEVRKETDRAYSVAVWAIVASTGCQVLAIFGVLLFLTKPAKKSAHG